MREQNWKRKEYDTWDEAFRGLAPVIRQQSIRVADYSRVLFVAACGHSYGKDTPEGAEQMRGQYADLAYKCGLYHQIGKALVPPDYQILESDFSEEEKAVYRKYTMDGAELAATLQNRTLGFFERRKAQKGDSSTQNIPWQMIRESCQQHMERWDGSGYPEGRRGDEISAIARIVGLAKELDRLSAETKSEEPFEEAMKTLVSQSGTLWPAELIHILQDCGEQCREVYEKYIYYTMTLPKTIPLVEKRPERPFGLKYRPMVSDKDGTVVAYEAVPWFRPTKNLAGEIATAEEQEDLLRRTGLVTNVTQYLLYEAADTLYRMDNCKLGNQGVLLQVLPDFYQHGSQMQMFKKLFEDQPVAKEKLMLTIPEKTVLKAGKGLCETISRYLHSGICLVLDGYHPDAIPAERLKELGFTHLRLDPELYMKQTTANTMYDLRKAGFTLLGSGADTYDLLAWQLAAGTVFCSGTITGEVKTEDEIIREAILKSR